MHSVRWTGVKRWALLHPELSRPDAPLLRGPLIGHASTPGRARTCNMRFWRPLLYHLSCRSIKRLPWTRTSRVYTHAPRSKLRSGGHIKTAPVLRRGCWLAHILSGKLHLGKDSKAFSWHGRLHVRPCGLSSPCAIWCEAADLHRTGLSLNRCDASHISSPRNVKREQSPVPASRKGGKCQEGTRFGGCVHRFAFWLFR